ncbi:MULTISPECIES: ABC transporter permease [Parageobacillus]|uniref:ABC transporter permease n=1 Tax=Parageobacillus TaxID=1906945 RepID=UPI001FCBA2E8|nr:MULTISPECIES: ABC transporter permease [Parageobacillus]MED4990769.1 ABC transporter permease [Parageobacillus toebii]
MIGMWTICFHEFKGLFKSIKSIIIVAIIFGVTYWTADLMTTITDRLDVNTGKDGYATGIASIVFLLGFLFISSLSHDVINREVSTRTMRFLVTKTSRVKIIIGKYLGIWLFWFFCIFTSFVLIAFVSKNFLWWGILECMGFISVAIAYNLVFSVIFPKPAITMFFGVVFALAFPVLSFLVIHSNNVFISWFKFFTPYYYALLGDFYILVNFVYAIGLLMLGIVLFNRRDL